MEKLKGYFAKLSLKIDLSLKIPFKRKRKNGKILTHFDA